MRAAPVLAFLLSTGIAGCDDIDDYRGDFRGGIVEGSFVRSCFPVNTTATLRFDPDRAVGDVSGLPPGARNWLSTDDGTFDQTVLEPISKLADDQLSLFDFPGPRRLRNYMLLARPTSGPLENRDALVVVSLLENGRVEVRVIGRTEDTTQACALEPDAGVFAAGDAGAGDAGARTDETVARPREYFGLFRLKSL